MKLSVVIRVVMATFTLVNETQHTYFLWLTNIDNAKQCVILTSVSVAYNVKKDQVHFRLRLLSTISLKPKNIHSHVAQYSKDILACVMLLMQNKSWLIITKKR